MATAQDWQSITKEQLSELYKTRSTYELAAVFGFKSEETIRKKLAQFDIPRRNRGGRRTFKPSAEELSALYQQHSMRELSRIYDVGETVVWKRLKEFDITLRDYEDGGHRKKPGKTFTEAHKEALSNAHKGKRRGSNNHNWKGGKTLDGIKLRLSPEYQEWKRLSLKRAGDKCEECGIQKGSVCKCCGLKMPLHVHHIEHFAKNPEKRFDPANSRVLCAVCHKRSHS